MCRSNSRFHLQLDHEWFCRKFHHRYHLYNSLDIPLSSCQSTHCLYMRSFHNSICYLHRLSSNHFHTLLFHNLSLQLDNLYLELQMCGQCQYMPHHNNKYLLSYKKMHTHCRYISHYLLNIQNQYMPRSNNTCYLLLLHLHHSLLQCNHAPHSYHQRRSSMPVQRLLFASPSV